MEAHNRQFDFVIVGGGASGVILAWHLMQKAAPESRILIVDPKLTEHLGEGLAYASESPELLLNVPTSKMGIIDSNPRDFESWLIETHPTEMRSANHPFVARHFFAKYLRARLQMASRAFAHFSHERSSVKKCAYIDGFWQIELSNSEILQSRKIILATGYDGIQSHPPTQGLSPDSCFSCFNQSKIEAIRDGESVMIVGTGLSAIDAWRSVRAKNQSGKITMISRHGIFPQPFVKDARPYTLGSLAGMSPREIFNLVRNLHESIKDVEQSAGIYLGLREQFQSIWSTWSRWEQRQFSEHIEPIWRVLRHRTPVQNWERMREEIQRGQINLLKGRIISSRNGPNGRAEIEYRPRGEERPRPLIVDKIIIATGPRLAQGLEISSLHGLQHEPQLWRIGPANRAHWGEVTAVAEIRQQAELIAYEATELQPTGSSLEKLFLAHARSQGESYWQHLHTALHLARRSLSAALKLIVHAVFPFIYPDTASDELRRLNLILGRRRISSIQRKLRREKLTRKHSERSSTTKNVA